jgi:cysteine desulfurase/selenocysteine lyase
MHPEFALEPGRIYLNHAAVAPWPRRSVAAVNRFAAENAARGSHQYPAWLQVETRLRQRLARLLNAPAPEDVALVKNTSEALSFVARGLTWSAGDNVVVIAQEFPSNRLPWQALAPLGVNVHWLDLEHSIDPEADLLARCDGNTRLLSVSAVQYARGLRLDLERLGAGCRRRGVLFCVDAIQQLGALPFDVQAARADFAAADGHKWLLGPEGLGVFYVRPELREQLTLTQHGWHMVEALGEYERLDWTPAASARRFECGSPNLLGAHALEASLALLEEVGMTEVAGAVQANAAAVVEAGLRQGLELLSPAAPERRAGIVTFRIPGADPARLHQALGRAGVACAPRGGGLRFSPHFHNTAEEIDQAFRLLAELRRQTP